MPLALHRSLFVADVEGKGLISKVLRQPKYAQRWRRDAEMRHDGLGDPFVGQRPGSLGIPGKLSHVEEAIFSFDKARLRPASHRTDNSLDFDGANLAPCLVKRT